MEIGGIEGLIQIGVLLMFDNRLLHLDSLLVEIDSFGVTKGVERRGTRSGRSGCGRR